MADRPYQHGYSDADLEALLADQRIGDPAKRRIREEQGIRRGEGRHGTAETRVEAPTNGVYFLDVAPVPKPRQTQRDKWKKRPIVQRYRAFCDAVRLEAQIKGFTMPEQGAGIRFNVPMAKSWSKKKKAEHAGQPHQQRPDVDNYLKAFMDALLPDGDDHVWHLSGLEKRWAYHGSIVVTVSHPDTEGRR